MARRYSPSRPYMLSLSSPVTILLPPPGAKPSGICCLTFLSFTNVRYAPNPTTPIRINTTITTIAVVPAAIDACFPLLLPAPPPPSTPVDAPALPATPAPPEQSNMQSLGQHKLPMPAIDISFTVFSPSISTQDPAYPCGTEQLATGQKASAIEHASPIASPAAWLIGSADGGGGGGGSVPHDAS